MSELLKFADFRCCWLCQRSAFLHNAAIACSKPQNGVMSQGASRRWQRLFYSIK